MLLRAKNRDEAYRKLVKCGSESSVECVSTPSGRRGFWRFEGVSLLLPIYDEIEDGAEVLWTKHRRTVQAIRARVPKKEDLPVFDDRD